MSFAALKKQSKAGSLTERLMKKVEKLNEKGGSNTDERLWKPSVDKAGNGFAVIRFLPAHANAELPWTQVWSHAFQGPGGWYIENSLTTIGKNDPVGELNRTLWNSGRESDKDIARKQKRKLSYYANVYIVKDSANPENEGQVKLYKFGKKIFDKITAAMQPEFEDEEPINPFDFWKGANFKLKIRKLDGYWNYDKSEFDKVSTLGDFDDAELEAIYKSEHSLTAFTDAKNFKTYEELEKRMNTVLSAKKKVSPIPDEDLEDESEGRGPIPSVSATVEPPAPRVDEEEEDVMSYFSRLAEE